ncbi:MAG: ABC transporter permease, partial [Opitutales bacterium]|nr:ABC transporter permease [Opitutales bacterium]
MRKLRVIKWALKAICRNPTRTFLTTLGIVIGIAAVIALMEIGTGAREALEKNMANMGINTIRVWPG